MVSTAASVQGLHFYPKCACAKQLVLSSHRIKHFGSYQVQRHRFFFKHQQLLWSASHKWRHMRALVRVPTSYQLTQYGSQVCVILLPEMLVGLRPSTASLNSGHRYLIQGMQTLNKRPNSPPPPPTNPPCPSAYPSLTPSSPGDTCRRRGYSIDSLAVWKGGACVSHNLIDG